MYVHTFSPHKKRENIEFISVFSTFIILPVAGLEAFHFYEAYESQQIFADLSYFSFLLCLPTEKHILSDFWFITLLKHSADSGILKRRFHSQRSKCDNVMYLIAITTL